MVRQKQIEEFLGNTEFAGADIVPLAGDASARRYARVMAGGTQAMVMDSPVGSLENFAAFIKIAEYLRQVGYSAPAIFARDTDKGFLLLEDFGDNSFTSIIANSVGDSESTMYESAIEVLACWHNSAMKIDSVPLYDDELYLREVSLFPDWFLVKSLGKEKVAMLRNEYMGIWSDILGKFSLQKNTLVHRDYHADNLMWLERRSGTDKVGLLDFQDAVMGDAAYDVVSLLEDARRDVGANLAEDMVKLYLDKTGIDADYFHNAYDVLGAQRNSKIIGIFTRLAVRDGKEHYLKMLPRVWKYLERDLRNPLLADLRVWLEQYVHNDSGLI
ncbi:MAG: phosphotransferase [Rickettsiales bacterium]